MLIWGTLNNFSISENWGNPQKISGFTLWILDKITNNIKNYTWAEYKRVAPCIVHCAYEKRETGYHPKGCAVDFHFKNIEASEAYRIITGTLKDLQVDNFVGLGVYTKSVNPDWKNSGFHLDTRGFKARWARVNGVYVGIEKGLDEL